MKAFMDEDFQLTTSFGKMLYHTYAEKMPIVDYHCHINPQEIYEDRRFENIAQVWLGGDHYKWRVMRACGVDEKYITGDGTDREKFQAWAESLPRAVGNPLYHWTHLELKRYFGYEGVLNGDTAQEVWDLCNEKLAQGDLTVRGIIEKSGVRLVCTTDGPVDSLEWHEKIAQDPTCKVKVLPAFRPDRVMNIHQKYFIPYIAELSRVTGMKIATFGDIKRALTDRIDYFDRHGCRASDHGLDFIPFAEATDEELDGIVQDALEGKPLEGMAVAQYQTALLRHVAQEYCRRGWVMQLHYGALRNANTRMYGVLGADTGYDCINTPDTAQALVRLLDSLEEENLLPKTILYSLNPNDNAVLTTAMGCFQHAGTRNWIQHGSAWWFNDTKDGMREQLRNLAASSVLGNFVGMLTDSRSFLSYTRHEYFRRILCALIGEWVENGEYPADEAFLGKLVQDISYNNAVEFFRFNEVLD
ncbi:MAG: glucuronate isomerase [Clostridia bacterium]|nr:glucuronate isomerase [Clostridia bacterium]